MLNELYLDEEIIKLINRKIRHFFNKFYIRHIKKRYYKFMWYYRKVEKFLRNLR